MQIIRWAVWRESRSTIALVLLLDGTASVLALSGIRSALTVPHLAVVLVLGALSVTYSMITRRSERLINALEQGRGPNLLGAFTFAGAMLVPPAAILVLVAVVYAADWPTRRSYGGKLFRHVSTAAVVAIASYGAAAVHHTFAGPVGVAAAILVFMALNVSLVAVAMVVAGQAKLLHSMFGSAKQHVMETGTQTLGAAMAAALDWHLALALTVPPVILGIQALSIGDRVNLTQAVDPSTDVWSEHGWGVLMAEAIAARQRFAVFAISPDCDDTVDPQLIRRVLESQMKSEYSVGCLTDGQIVVLMPRMVDAAARLLARRFTTALAAAGVEVTIGTSAGYPDGPDQGDIMLTAFSAVVARRASRSKAQR